MLWVDRVGDRRSWAILARNFSVKTENSLNFVSTCLKVVDTRRFKVKDSTNDIGLWMNVFLTCLGYIVGILTGLLGLRAPNPPAPSTPQTASSAELRLLPARYYLPLRELLLLLSKHAISALFVIATIYGLRYVLGHLLFDWAGVPEKVRVIATTLDYWAVLSVLVLFLANAILLTTFRMLIPIRQVLKTRRSAGQQSETLDGTTQRDVRGSVLSYTAGFFGLVVVFALMHRATITEDPLSKLLFYVAAFVLLFEVLLMAAQKNKDRITHSILSLRGPKPGPLPDQMFGVRPG